MCTTVDMMERNLGRKFTGEPYDAKVSRTVRREAVGKVRPQYRIRNSLAAYSIITSSIIMGMGIKH